MEIIFSISGKFKLRRNNWAVRPVHNHDVHHIYAHGEWDDELMVWCAGKRDEHGGDTFWPNNISACQNLLTGNAIEAVWQNINKGQIYQRDHILYPCRWFGLSMRGNGIFTPNLRWSDSEFTCRISRDPGVMTSRLQVVQLLCVSDRTS